MNQLRLNRLPKITILIIAANVIYFLFLLIKGNINSSGFMLQYGALHASSVLQKGEYYRIITSMFMHFDFQHIFFNMLLLYFIGDIVEREIGGIRYLIIYMGSGIIANIVSVYYYNLMSYQVVSAGASGAVFGITGVLLYILLQNRGYIKGVTTQRLVIMIVFNIYNGFTGTSTNNVAHISGLIAGFLAGIVLYKKAGRKIPDEWY